MIASVHGKLLREGAGYLVIEVGGVGMRVEVPSGVRAPRVRGEEVFMHTTLIVREDSLTLFGFETLEEIEVFEHIITVSGVGPKTGLGVLSVMSPTDITRAVMNEDDKAFRQAPGIGPKTSKQLILSLTGKLDHLTHESAVHETETQPRAEVTQVLIGLQGLGWSEAQADQAITQALEAGAEPESSQLMRAALRLLQAGGVRR